MSFIGHYTRYWLRYCHAHETFRSKGTLFQWLFGFRDVCRAIVDARTIQACVMPRFPCLDGCPLLVFESEKEEASLSALYLNTLWASFILDYVARQKIHGAHLTKAIAYQLPLPTPERFEEEFLSDEFGKFILPRALELTYVTKSLFYFAADCGYGGSPFRWDEERRFLMRCELDAAYFHLYGIKHDDVNYIMETFPIVKRKDEQKHGEYRTKRVILEIYDAMAHAMKTGEPYQTLLDPPPADPRVAHPPKEIEIERPKEIAVADFISMAYPSTKFDKAISAAALAIVERAGEISSIGHLDALLLTTHPGWCRAFLDLEYLQPFDATEQVKDLR